MGPSRLPVAGAAHDRKAPVTTLEVTPHIGAAEAAALTHKATLEVGTGVAAEVVARPFGVLFTKPERRLFDFCDRLCDR